MSATRAGPHKPGAPGTSTSTTAGGFYDECLQQMRHLLERPLSARDLGVGISRTVEQRSRAELPVIPVAIVPVSARAATASGRADLTGLPGCLDLMNFIEHLSVSFAAWPLPRCEVM